jgi:hypothetical protein
MKLIRWFLIGMALFVMTFPSFAKSHLTIDVKAIANLASDVVVVTEGDTIDGQLTILETWKGKLKVGDKLSIPEFQDFKEKTTCEVKWEINIAIRGKDDPLYVTCSRMILFLQKKSHSGLPQKQWVGVVSGDVIASTIWIEGKQAFAFYDRYKEGKGFLSYYSSEEKIKKIVSSAKR